MANYTWKSNLLSANWTSGNNWAGGTVGNYPGQSSSADTATLAAPPSAGFDYTVTYNLSSLTIGGLKLAGAGVRATTLSLSGGNTLTVDGTINVGSTTSSTGSAIVGSGLLQAGGGGLVSLTTADSNGLQNTTGATAGTGLASSVLLGDDNTAGTVLQLDSAAGSSINNAFGFSGTAGDTLSLFEESVSGSTENLNYTGTISGLNVASTNGVTGSGLSRVNFVNIEGSASVTDVTWSGATITVDYSNGASGTLTLGSAVPGGDFVDWVSNASAGGLVIPSQSTLTGTDIFLSSVVCFAAGTRIAAARGEMPVEDLAEGDLVVTLSGSERTLEPVTWIGYRRVDLASHPRRELVAPVRIRRGAFGENMPQRDVAVSPDHALFVDGKLVVARLLLNGMTIAQDMDARSVEYYHVELPRHAVLLAEGLPAESYLDTGNRAMFSNAGLALVLHPDFGASHGVRTWDADACAPLVTEAAEVEPMWRRLAERAESLGYAAPRMATTTDADLHLMVDGRRIQPVSRQNGRHVFLLPHRAASIRLVSRASAPTDVAPYLEDRRRLGVAVSRLVLRLGTEQSEIPVDHPTLSRGWHAVEREAREMRRWTDGDADLAVALEGGFGLAMLEVHTSCANTYRLGEAATDRLAA
jgi:hypothetical protein